MATLMQLEQAWLNDPRFQKRAHGGRNALDGFAYQFYFSLNRFFQSFLHGHTTATSFEGLSDLAQSDGNALYLIQCKLTLTKEAMVSACQELLAVDRFLQGQQAADNFSYEIAVREVETKKWLNPAAWDAKALGLEGDPAKRWEQLRHRVGIVQQSAPKRRLQILLYPQVLDAFGLVDESVGLLLQNLADRKDSQTICTELDHVFRKYRKRTNPHLALVSPEVFASGKAFEPIHGRRPSWDELAHCYMPRPDRLEQARAALLKAIKDHQLQSAGQYATPDVLVFWIVGASGAGKSVFLLQLLRQLMVAEELPCIFLHEWVTHLAEALSDQQSLQDTSLLLAVDDCYEPKQRKDELWATISQSARQPSARGKTIITCGPREYYEAFEEWQAEHEGFKLVPFELQNLEAQEKASFHQWYNQHAGTQLPASQESNFIVAMWTYELMRKQGLSVAEFARRFRKRLQEMQLESILQACLALCRLDFVAPEDLFEGHRDAQERLLKDDLFRMTTTGDGTTTGHGIVIHASIAEAIYAVWVREDQQHQRATDLGIAFNAMQEEQAQSFLSFLRRVSAKERMGAELLGKFLEECLKLLLDKQADPDQGELLLLWARLSLLYKQAPTAAQLKRLQAAYLPSELTNPIWPYGFLLLWRLKPEQQPGLSELARTWLVSGRAHALWPQLWLALIASKDSRPQLMNDDFFSLALLWLGEHSGSPHFGEIWLSLSKQDQVEKAKLAEVGLKRMAQDTAASSDRLILSALAKLPCDGVVLTELWLKRLIVHYPLMGSLKQRVALTQDLAAFANSPEKHEILAKTYQAHLNEEHAGYVGLLLLEFHPKQLLPLCHSWLSGREDRVEWNYMWQKLLDLETNKDPLLELGRAWLLGREDRDDWSHVFQKLLDLETNKGPLLDLGRAWLLGREDRADWSHILEKLLDLDTNKGPLLDLGRAWLLGREDRDDWSHILEKLLDLETNKGPLLDLGRAWLLGREDRDDWAFIFQKLLDLETNKGPLLDLGRAWLLGREDRDDWSHILEKLLDLETNKGPLLDLGRAWLLGREDRDDWAFIFQKLLDLETNKGPLLDLGRAWLLGREDRDDWSHILEKLLDLDANKGPLLDLGRAWLLGREDRDDWAFIFQKLLDLETNKGPLLDLGRAWLLGREDRDDWAFIFQKLLDLETNKGPLLDLGRAWLLGREDRADWAFIFQKLLDLETNKGPLLDLGRAWLLGREERADWAFIFQKLLDLETNKGPLLDLARAWLLGREDRADWAFIFQKLLDLDANKGPLLDLGRAWLLGREERADWAFIFQKLLKFAPDKQPLLEIGLDWLHQPGRGRRKDWPYVYQALLEQARERHPLLDTGLNWLKPNHRHASWPFVFLKLLAYFPKNEALKNMGWAWQAAYPKHRKAGQIRYQLNRRS